MALVVAGLKAEQADTTAVTPRESILCGCNFRVRLLAISFWTTHSHIKAFWHLRLLSMVAKVTAMVPVCSTPLMGCGLRFVHNP